MHLQVALSVTMQYRLLSAIYYIVIHSDKDNEKSN